VELWRCRYGDGLAVNRSRVRLLAGAPSSLTARDAPAPYPWSRDVYKLRATETEMSAAQWDKSVVTYTAAMLLQLTVTEILTEKSHSVNNRKKNSN